MPKRGDPALAGIFHDLFTIKGKNFHAGFLRGLRVLPSLTGALLLHLQWRRDEMTSTKRLTFVSTAAFPPLRRPKPEIADRGTLRLGSGNITAAFPSLRRSKPDIADRGTLRLGSGNITAAFPPLR
jgi:hypothetical protein